jgi:UDP-N-acetylmuramoyl-tripeptide--D-alanyl-D-alanine ligase
MEKLHICTDTRKIKAGDTFYALKGENFDGHNYILQAFEKGAVCAVCEYVPEDVLDYLKTCGGEVSDIGSEKCDAETCGENILQNNENKLQICKNNEKSITKNCKIVNNVLKELLKTASDYRKCYKIPLIGITGSVGKTTTKEMVALVMSSKYKTLKTNANLNNEIGTAWTLLELDDTYSAAVLEMGMNHYGELEQISNAAMPTCGVITNIGDSHIGNLGSREGILKAKLEILSGMEPCAPLVINNDDEYLSRLTLNRPTITVGIKNKNSDYVAENIISVGGKTEFDIVYDKKRKHVALPALGTHNVLNALISFAVGKLYNISAKDIADSILNYKNVGDRQNIVRKNSYTLIVDCYNASYQSIKASIEVLDSVCNASGEVTDTTASGEVADTIESGEVSSVIASGENSDTTASGRKLIVLGDVLELGEFAEKIHRKIGGLIPSDALFFAYGENMKFAAECAKNEFTFHTNSMGELCETVRDNIRKGDTILVKGSNGMKLINLINYLNGQNLNL